MTAQARIGKSIAIEASWPQSVQSASSVALRIAPANSEWTATNEWGKPANERANLAVVDQPTELPVQHAEKKETPYFSIMLLKVLANAVKALSNLLLCCKVELCQNSSSAA